MKVELRIKYNTVTGECLVVCINNQIHALSWQGNGIWAISLELKKGLYEYHYELHKDFAAIRKEPTSHFINVGSIPQSIWDWWQDRAREYYDNIHSVFGTYGSRAAGIAVPVFSLRTEKSFGVGEFTDLVPLVDFAVKTGLHCIQLLPVNDTTRTFTKSDSYPYSACSSFALHPQFINLEKAGVEPDDEFVRMRDEFNSCPQLDYEAVNRAKDMLLRRTFSKVFGQESKSLSYRKFVKNNWTWLLPYACYRALITEYKTPDFSQWPQMSVCGPGAVDHYYASNPDEVNFHMWVQYHLDSQFSEVVRYARKNGVYFKGDLPIGVARFSADAWEHPELFNMNFSAGAPPDFFSRDGQNWGFPTYNWAAMAKTKYAWWKARLGKMSEYFDAYRIDHILGFFRIWEIPYVFEGQVGTDVSGTKGHFNPALPYSEAEISYFDIPGSPSAYPHPLFLPDPHTRNGWNPKINAHGLPAYEALDQYRKDAFNFLYNDYFFHRHENMWKELSLGKLKAVTTCTGMLACGEDLGMVAHCVPGVMDQFNILSLEMPRMPKEIGPEFGEPMEYQYMSVCTTGTHDMSPTRLWWTQSHEQAQHFYNNVLGWWGEAPADPGTDVCSAIVSKVLGSPSMLCIIPLQDYLSCGENMRIDASLLSNEQINIPADPHHYWRYRMNVTIEKMLADTEYCEHIRKMVKDALR